MRRLPYALLGLIALAALVRFWRIGHQSYWLDESYTVGIVRRGFGGMLHEVRQTESTPPLYYALAWLWERVLGWHEVALRSLSALFGVATVPVAYAAAREAFGRRAALIAAALVAVNPYFVWYSQEARAYALLVLLSAAGLLFFLRAERSAGRRSLWLWALFSGLALLTHYFALFLIVPEAAWLAYRHRSRMLAPLAAVVAVAGALVPLALDQRDSGHTLFIAHIPFGERFTSLPKKLVTGELGTPTPAIGALAGAALVAALALALVATRGHERRSARLLTAFVAIGVIAAVVLKLAGLDYFFPRNLIELFVPAILVLAAGFAAVRPAVLGAAVAVIVALTVVVEVGLNSSLQRDDWRGLARALGPARTARAIVLTPGVADVPVELYARGTRRLPLGGVEAPELDLIAGGRPPRFAPPPTPAGFRLAERRQTDSWQLLRYVAPRPLPLQPPFLVTLRLERGSGPALLLQAPTLPRP